MPVSKNYLELCIFKVRGQLDPATTNKTIKAPVLTLMRKQKSIPVKVQLTRVVIMTFQKIINGDQKQEILEDLYLLKGRLSP